MYRNNFILTKIMSDTCSGYLLFVIRNKYMDTTESKTLSLKKSREK